MLSDLTDRARTLLGADSAAIRIGQRLYGRYLEAVAGDRGLRWRVNGGVIRIDPRVRRLIPHVTEPALFDYLRTHVEPGQIVLDIGAFLGTYAIFEARWVGERGRVVALEPTPASCATIRMHLRMNGVQDRVTLIEAAAGAEPGEATLDESPEPYRNQLTSRPAGRRVRVVTIDDVCEQMGLRPDWIRMDVQGSELDVLRGARRTFAASNGRLRAVVEMHPFLWRARGFGIDDARAQLRELGLTATGIEDPQDPFADDAHALIASS